MFFYSLPQSGVVLSKIFTNEEGKLDGSVFLYLNPFCEKIFGVPRQQLLFKTATEVQSKLDLPFDLNELFDRLIKTGLPQREEVYVQSLDKWFLIYIYSLKKNYAIAFFMDITPRKKNEQALILSGKWFRRLYETTHDGIMARDLNGKMIDCNPAYAKMLGYTKTELRNLAIDDLLPDEWLDQRERIVNHVLKTGRSIVFTREYKRKDGTIFPASVRTWRLTDDKGNPAGVWSIVRDISEQKELQRKLEKYAGFLEKIVEERTKKLKESERLAAIGQTAGMVGHDLRNPLQTVIGELYLAKCEVDLLPSGELKNNLQESIRVIEEQAVYMDKIVSDLQAFVRPLRLEMKLINLKQLVDAVLTSISFPPNVTVKTRLTNGATQVNADPQLIKRVLINLVTNAVQAMPEGGKITLTSHADAKGQVSVTVKDTGVGIPEKIKPQIFTPLFTTKPRGQGFGLAVCKRVMEAHGGTISFESKEGEGAKFTIKLPAA